MKARGTLIVFDIDGTLTDTAGLHGKFIAQCLLDSGVSNFNSDWNSYAHHTDSHILRHIYEIQNGRAFSKETIRSYDLLLERRYRELHKHVPISQITGATDLLTALAQSEIPFCFATGGLRKSAELKLIAAGIPFDPSQISAANDFETRIEIVRDSVRRRAEKSAHPVSRIISVGDGPWDLETAQEAGIDFVGVTMNATPPSFCSSRPVICSGNQESLLKLLDYL